MSSPTPQPHHRPGVLGRLADIVFVHRRKAGRVEAPVAGRFALRDAAAALRFAEEGGLVGKVVIVAEESSR